MLSWVKILFPSENPILTLSCPRTGKCCPANVVLAQMLTLQILTLTSGQGNVVLRSGFRAHDSDLRSTFSCPIGGAEMNLFCMPAGGRSEAENLSYRILSYRILLREFQILYARVLGKRVLTHYL